MGHGKSLDRSGSPAGSLTLDGSGSSLHGRNPGGTPIPTRGGLSTTDPNAESKLPMPGDGAREGSGKAGSGDTAAALTGKSGSGGPRTATSTLAATSYDTIVGRMVIEQGLATNEEVESAKRLQVEIDDPNQRSLAQILVDNEVVTSRQIERLRTMAEEEKKGQAIPGYKVLAKLGAGAMATVFKARQLSLDRLVAIKILPRKFSNNSQFIERFYAEGRAAAQLNHPNIVQAYDVGQSGEFHYFVMEYVEGATVHDLIVANKRFNEQEALDIAIATAEALEHAHSRGLIHRDIKPKNIMIAGAGTVKVADLGLARAIGDKEAALAEAGKAYGTPYYISPEQIRGEVDIGPTADIYSLGATLYHMLTGNVPYNGKNPQEVMQKHLKAELVPPDHVNPKLNAGVSEVIERMMARHRKDRYKNCHELLIDLRAVKRGERPPIAHKEVPASTIIEAVQSQALKTAPAMLQAAPASGRRSVNLILLYAAIAAICYGLIITLVFVGFQLNK